MRRNFYPTRDLTDIENNMYQMKILLDNYVTTHSHMENTYNWFGDYLM